MEEFVRSPLVLGILWGFLAVARGPLTSLLKKTGVMVGSPLFSTTTAISRVADEAKAGAPAAQQVNDQVVKTLVAVIDKVMVAVESVSAILRSHLRAIIAEVAPVREHRMARILGSIIYLVVLPLFLYSDMAQGANNLTTLFPYETVPPFLQNLTIPLLISSAGTALVLGMMLGDLFRLTHFDLWGELKGFSRFMLISVVLLNLILSVLCSTLLALNRFPELVDTVEATRLDPAISTPIHQMAALSQSLIILPLLITTVLLFTSPVGLLSLYALVIAITFFLFVLTGFSGNILKAVVSVGGVGTDAMIRIIGFAVQLALHGLAWVGMTATMIFVKLVDTLAEVLNVIVFPLTWVGQGVAHVTRQSEWFKFEEKRPNEDKIIDLLDAVAKNTGSAPSGSNSANGHKEPNAGDSVSTNGHKDHSS